MTNTQIETALSWRYAAKRFDSEKKISDQDWQTLSASLIQAPSTYGLQPWRFFVIENPALRARLKTASWNQSQVTDASHFIVFASKEKVTAEDIQTHIDRIAEVRNLSRESLAGFKDMMLTNVAGLPSDKALEWTRRQAYIAMGFLLETSALLGIDSTPMEGLDPAEYDKILGLEGSGWKSVAAVALGYRHPDDQLQTLKKVRFANQDIIHYR